MGSGTAVYTPPTPISDAAYPNNSVSRSASEDRRQNEEEERQIFSKLEKPRVRYDVEVITKLIVYTGMRWLKSFLVGSADSQKESPGGQSRAIQYCLNWSGSGSASKLAEANIHDAIKEA